MIKLVDDWREFYKWYSIHAAAILTALSLAQSTIPQIQALIPLKVFPMISTGLGVAIIICRLLAQGTEKPQ